MDLGDRSKSEQALQVAVAPRAISESFSHGTVWNLEKRDCSIEAYIADQLPEDLRIFQKLGAAGASAEEVAALTAALKEKSDELLLAFHAEIKPYETIDFEGNILVTVGITLLLDLLGGAGGQVLNNANAFLGVGESVAGASAGQVKLQGASRLNKAMNGSYPIVASPKVTYQSTFASGEANWAWNEVGTFNNVANDAGEMLNRKVQALGTKSSGATWTLTEDITFT